MGLYECGMKYALLWDPLMGIGSVKICLVPQSLILLKFQKIDFYSIISQHAQGHQK
jgi:hypothetical protein